MQRGGSWDNADVKGAKKLPWSRQDKEYDAGGFKDSQSVSIFGGSNLPWNNSSKQQQKTTVVATPEKKGPFGLW